MTAVALTVNGERVSAEVEPRTHLGDFLREQLRLTGTHLGCEHGVCGACTVLIDGQPARSCLTFAVACDGLDVRTIEGFEDDPPMAALREAFSREHGLQCGFCTPGMLIAARDIVLRLPDADERRVRVELSGNLCRCTGYLGIVNAVRSVLEQRRAGGTPAPVAAAALAAAAPARFTPAAAPAVAPMVAAADAPARQGWTRFAETFVIAQPPAVVWAALADFPVVAACLPGAELTEHDARTVKGRLHVKLGPMQAAFAGSAVIERDDASLTGTAKGAGGDNASRSRTRAELTYRLTSEGAGTRIAVAVEYDLQGPLAQFSRSGLAQELGRRIVGVFAANLNARLSGGGAAVAPAALSAGRLVWQAIWARVKALLGLR
ncbi:MAG TPA: 2Fe-2S iron-sulfur cluster-binding protein [Candidatus Sulfotelmatobacter sp.]|nr:2Fe-2S iron-sulfur cluster-binding protein [Candidatus Sulfotelmatobacter sp.]